MDETSHLLSIDSQNPIPSQDIDREDALQRQLRQQTELKVYYSTLVNALSFGSVGLAMTSMYVNLDLVASKVGKSSDAINIGSIYVGPLIGSIIGCLSWPVSSNLAPGGYSIMVCLTGLVAIFLGLAVTSHLSTVYILFFLIGMFGALLGTGAFSLIRTIQKGEEACGPWFSAASICNMLMGLLGVLLNYLLNDATEIFLAVSFVFMVVITFNLFWQQYTVSSIDQSYLTVLYEGLQVGRYTVEMVCGTCMGCINGGISSIIAYLDTYIDETGVLTDGNYATTVFWCAVIAGQMILMAIQTKVTTARLLVIHTLSALVMIFVSLFLGVFYSSVSYFWVALVILGLLLGATFGIIMDLVNRLTKPSDISTTIIFVCFHVTSYLVVYLISAVWEYSSVGASSLFFSLMVLAGLSMAVLIAPSLQFRRQYFDNLI